LGLGLVVSSALGQSPRVLQETLPPDSQPIQLNADYVAAWQDAGQQTFLLRGNVIVTQGAAAIRANDVVVWVDMQRFQRDGVFNVVVYGDKAVSLEHGTKVDADFGYVRMTTSGKVNIKSFKSTAVQQEMSSDPVYQRALARRPANGRTEGRLTTNATSAPTVDENVRPAALLQPPPLPPPAVNPVPQPPIDPLDKMRTDPVPMTVMPVPVDSVTPGVNAPAAPKTVQTKPHFTIRPRYQGDLQWKTKPVEGGMTAIILSGGISMLVTVPPKTPGKSADYIDIEADRIVIWTKGNAKEVVSNMNSSRGDDSGSNEVYLSGHVELRTRSEKSIQTLRADEIYYDFSRNAAVAREADLEMLTPKVPTPIRFKTYELIQENASFMRAQQAVVASSKLPSDPGLKVDISNFTVEEIRKDRSYLYGLWPAYDKEGKRLVETDHIFTGRNMFVTLEGVPVFYFPYLKDRVEDPLGPLDAVGFGYDRILGFQIRTTWDMYDLLDLPHFDGTRWRLYLDYLTLRGFGFGTQYELSGKDYFGIKGDWLGLLKLYGIADRKADILGFDRGNIAFWPDQFTTWPIQHPDFRGVAQGKINIQEMDNGFSVLGQFGFISDRNFIEQYYLDSHLNDLNYDTYLRVKQQHGNWAWTLYGQVSVNDWLTETNWLPKADGYLLGQTFSFNNLEDLFVYNGHISAGYAQLLPASQVPYAYLPTDVRTNTVRLDLMQDISMPVYLGPFKVAPYLVGDLTYYSEDVNGDAVGRFYGGGGVRGSIPFSRLYPDIQSDLFNLNQIYHKIVFTANYFNAWSSVSLNSLPQLNRLNDDSSDQALRDIRPVQPIINPANAAFLTTSNLFNPQNYALRRLVDISPDTLDSMQVIQLGLRQRWQTLRGFPGSEHVVDWMTLNLNASIFPQANRDNFGHTFGILEYDWIWNIGDRTALTSYGWFEPFPGGPRAVDVGTILGRPDASNFYLGYRQIDPLNSKAVIASITYPFSSKYALTGSTVWDFGNHVSTYSLFVSRMGTDVIFNLGFSYNSTLNTFGLAVEVLPNLALKSSRAASAFPMPATTGFEPILNQR
jgi:lipopolysaccharide export system protein LptA